MVPVLPSSIQPSGLYNPGDVCQALGIGRTTLWRYTKEGRIKAVRRPGSSVNLYKGQDVINLHRIVY